MERPSVSKVLQRYGQQYLDRFGTTMTAQQKKTLRAVMACRTEALGTIRYLCLSCGHERSVPRSCCNRQCPACQQDKAQQWLQTQLDRLLPCAYFLITFTVPPELRGVMMAHPQEGYNAMFHAAVGALKKAAHNERHVGAGQLGFFGVLHTSGRALTFHPHCHFVVAGGAVGEGAWKPSRADYFVPERVLSILFRAKLRDELQQAGLPDDVPAEAWQRDWTVDAVAAGDGQASLKYLAPYVFRGPVSNWRVTDCCWSESLDDARLVLQVKPSGTRKYRPMPLTVTEFIRRWLQHVLPSGFQRVRHYGFLNSHSKLSLREVRWLIAVSNGLLFYLACGVELVLATAAKMTCPECGGPMICRGYWPPAPDLVEMPVTFTARAPPDMALSMASVL
jgi:predicted RNA-binding Zn-ribbon protein involved in translation (DUF1610 family)